MTFNIVVSIILAYLFINAVIMAVALKTNGDDFNEVEKKGMDRVKTSKKDYERVFIFVSLFCALPALIISLVKNSKG